MLDNTAVDAHETIQRTLSDTFNAILKQVEVGMTASEIKKIGEEKLLAAGFNETWDVKTSPLRIYANGDTRANIHTVPYAVDHETPLDEGDLVTFVSRPIKDNIRAFGVLSRFLARAGDHTELAGSETYKQIPSLVMQMSPDTKASDATHIITEHLAKSSIVIAPKKRVGYPLGNLSLYNSFNDEAEAQKTLGDLAPFYLTVPVQIDLGDGPMVYRQGHSFTVRDGSIQRLIRR